MTELATQQHLGDTSSGPTASAVLVPSATSLGKYRVLSELGRGGMANVYLAVTRGPNAVSKLVVLKALLPELATQPSALRSFLDEARLAAQLNHGNVVQTYEIGTQGDRQVIVMEYLEGQSLGSVIRHSAATDSPLSLGFQLRIIISVLEGLQYAHELRGYDGLPLMLVHRDISPQNVFVTYDGQVKVLDFGIAKAVTSRNETAAGMIKGKLSFMSPEQMVGERVDRRADVYSVGCMLWAAAAGRKLWKDTPGAQVMRAVMNGEVPSPQSVNPNADPELCRIVMKCLATDCGERFQSALELQEQLEHYCEERSIRNRPRDLGLFVSKLFAATRAELRARVEQQLSQVDLVDAALTTDPDVENTISVASRAVQNAGSTATGLSSASTNLAVTTRVPSKSPARWMLGLSLAVLGAALVWRAAPRAHSAVGAPPLPAQAVTKAAPENATVELRSLPGNAQLFLDGQPLYGNPSTRMLPKDGKIHTLRAESDGYHLGTAEFTVAKDDSVELRLEKLETPASASPVASDVRPRAAVRKLKLAPPTDNCAQPFFIDQDGIKKLRPACL